MPMTNDELLYLYLLARSLWWRHDLEQLDADAVAAVIAALESAQKDIASRLAEDAAGLSTLTEWRREQDEALNAWADEVLAGARATVTGTISEASIAAATASLAAYNAILSLDGKASAVKTVGLSSEQIRAWFQDTALGSGGLERWVDTALDNGVKQSILAALRKVAVEGKGTAEAVRRVIVAANDAGFEITRREAITVTRTFIQTANVRAQEAVYEANRALIKGYKRVETLDNKTCAVCLWGDGAVYGLDEPRPSLPAHARCRGTWIVIAKSWRDFGIDVDDLEAVARPWTIRDPGPIGTGGRKIQNYGKTTENYSGWWASLSDADKAKTAVGKVRRKLLESGAVSWDDMWDKATGLPKTLAQIGYDKAKQLDILYPGRKAQPTQGKAISFGKDSSVDDIIKYGRSIAEKLPDPKKDANAFHDALLERMRKDVGIGVPCKVASRGEGARIVQDASSLFPSSWNEYSDRYGELKAKATRNRAFYSHYEKSPSEIAVDGFICVAVHEYAHRLQHVMPDIDAKFQEIHRKRTEGEELEKMRKLFPKIGYKNDEVTRKDGYFHPYMGKEYKEKGALELMSMSFQAVLGHNKKDIEKGYPAFLEQIAEKDEEMVHFVLGLIFGWKG